MDPETYYYPAMAYHHLQDRSKVLENLAQAKKLYEEGRHRSDPYDNPEDRIYREDIERALSEW